MAAEVNELKEIRGLQHKAAGFEAQARAAKGLPKRAGLKALAAQCRQDATNRLSAMITSKEAALQQAAAGHGGFLLSGGFSKANWVVSIRVVSTIALLLAIFIPIWNGPSAYKKEVEDMDVIACKDHLLDARRKHDEASFWWGVNELLLSGDLTKKFLLYDKTTALELGFSIVLMALNIVPAARYTDVNWAVKFVFGYLSIIKSRDYCNKLKDIFTFA